MKILSIIIITIMLICSNIYSDDIQNVQDIKNILRHYRYVSEIGTDYWQTPEETIALKTGDCEDFAFLVQYYLDKINIKGYVVIVKYKKLKLLHAICIWKNKDKWSFSSNTTIRETRYIKLDNMIRRYYPDVDYYGNVPQSLINSKRRR